MKIKIIVTTDEYLEGEMPDWECVEERFDSEEEFFDFLNDALDTATDK